MVNSTENMKVPQVTQIVAASGRTFMSAYLTWPHAVQLLLVGTLANQYMTSTQIDGVKKEVECVQKDVDCVKRDVARVQRDVDRLSEDVRQLSSEVRELSSGVREILRNQRRSWW